ncbi:MAG: hypothetical protein HS113_08040 [Verrucomicrobiales bacterium]|nr:hypothetical protein [Verrucomicrobiales bacterium]
MNPPLLHPSFAFPPTGFGRQVDPFAPRPQPTLLVGIQRDLAPPLAWGSTRLQRMRIILVEPRLASELRDPDPAEPDPDGLAEVLPPWRPPRERAASALGHPRPVLGEILRGEDGTLYERFGTRIRPLLRLAAGPQGDVLEVADTGDAPRLRARVPLPPTPPEATRAEAPATPQPDPHREPPPPAASPAAVPTADAARHAPPAFRSLLPEPGQWRVVRFADFKPMLLAQLAHPERLRDTHRLPCYVQVFEILRPQRWEALAAALFGDETATQEAQPLTPAAVQQLQLGPLLPPPPHAPRPARRLPGLLLPSDRVFCLELAQDPTEAPPDASAPNTPPATPSTPERQPDQPSAQPIATAPYRPKPELTPPPVAPDLAPPAPTPAAPLSGVATLWLTSATNPAPPAPSTPPAPPGDGASKTSIPAAFLKPWEFQLSREEALFDLLRSRSWLGRLRLGLRRWFTAWGRRHEWRLWQVRLQGKDPDEQLWAVPPPRGGAPHPLVRAWAERTLEAAGYAPRPMLTEWEIFWRRKGA